MLHSTNGVEETQNDSTFTFSFSLPARLEAELNGVKVSYQTGKGKPLPIKGTFNWSSTK